MYKERRLNAVVYEYVEAMQVKVKVNPMCLWLAFTSILLRVLHLRILYSYHEFMMDRLLRMGLQICRETYI